jgi:hypothetical protein
MHSPERSAGQRAACLNEKHALSRNNANRHVLGVKGSRVKIPPSRPFFEQPGDHLGTKWERPWAVAARHIPPPWLSRMATRAPRRSQSGPPAQASRSLPRGQHRPGSARCGLKPSTGTGQRFVADPPRTPAGGAAGVELQLMRYGSMSDDPWHLLLDDLVWSGYPGRVGQPGVSEVRSVGSPRGGCLPNRRVRR